MYKGIIVENSLENKDVLNKVEIVKTWVDDDWTLHSVLLSGELVQDLSQSLKNEPWYMHVWKIGTDEIKVIYKDKVFNIVFSDRSTWKDAIAYGKTLGIPEEQLDFLIEP